MINFLTHREIDKQKWDRCIEQAGNTLIYGYSWYLDSIAPGWCGLVLNDYDAVMPVPTAKKFFTIAYQPFFAQQLGIFNREPLNLFTTADFIAKIPERYKYIYVCLNETNDPGLDQSRITRRDNYVLYLHQSYEDTAKNFTDHCRRNIRRAEKENLAIESCLAPEVVDFYIEHKGARTENIKTEHYQMLRKVMDEAGHRNMLQCYKMLSPAGDTIACAAFYMQPGRIIYQLGTANDQGRETRALYFLFDHIIRKHCAQNLILDFEGSQISSIARFFNGFGSMRVPYYCLIINRLPWPFRWLKK